jgi:subtilisin family serine protease
MRRLVLFATALLVVACSDRPGSISAPEASVAAGSTSDLTLGQVPLYQPGVVVARFVPGAPARDIAAGQGAAVTRTLAEGIRVLGVPEGREQTVAVALARNPGVLFAELSLPRLISVPCAAPGGDCGVPSDEHFGRRWDLHNDGAIRDGSGTVIQTAGLVPDADMDWLEAYEVLGSFAGDALVGVVDTGIDPGHTDLAGRLQVQHDFFNIDAIAEDDHGHGTHVSGIIAAHVNNGSGGGGVAWGPGVRLAMAKGCGNTIIGYLCWSPDIADGIMWLADQGAAAINLSLGGASPSSAEQVALQYAVARDVLPVCAAGNNGSSVEWPAAFPECMAVSSTGWNDMIAGYSSRGSEVEVAAPGGEIIRDDGLDRILSTWPGGGYVYLSGTSMASPQVAGLAGLLHALGVTSAADKRQIITETADDLGDPGVDPLYGHGRVNVWAAVQAALGDPPPPPPPPDNEAPTAAFDVECTDLDCQFQDLSTDDGGVQTWLWDFGDGTTSPVRNPSHSYAAAGTYTVMLTVDDGEFSDDTSGDVTVTDPPPPPPNEPPTAAFTFSCSGPTCDFTDTSTDDGGVVAWLWDFGDGAFSGEQSPTHTFAPAAYPATYTVSLLVEDADMELDLISQDVTVTRPPPVLRLDGRDKLKGELIANLSWTGLETIDLYRDGGLIASGLPSPGAHEDFTGQKGKATVVYEACYAGTTECSDPLTVVF